VFDRTKHSPHPALSCGERENLRPSPRQLSPWFFHIVWSSETLGTFPDRLSGIPSGCHAYSPQGSGGRSGKEKERPPATICQSSGLRPEGADVGKHTCGLGTGLEVRCGCVHILSLGESHSSKSFDAHLALHLAVNVKLSWRAQSEQSIYRFHRKIIRFSREWRIPLFVWDV
jgi:hypothetical protein